jgi:hypothetical protein
MLTRAEQYQWTKAVCFAVGGRFLGLRGFIARWVTSRRLSDADELDEETRFVDNEKSVADEFHCDRLLDRVAQVPVKALGSAHTVGERIFR